MNSIPQKVCILIKLGNLSFADGKYLYELLNVEPGSVTPFGLLNDNEKKIKFFLDLKLNKFDSFNFHPLVNTATIRSYVVGIDLI